MIPIIFCLALVVFWIRTLSSSNAVLLEYNESEPISTLSNAEFCQLLDFSSLSTTLERYVEHVAIYFENLTTGCTFTHVGQQEFFAASITKAPYALWLYMQAEQGLIDLEEMITYTEADYLGGSGMIRLHYEFGHSFTISRLIELNLYESDNIATGMLQRRFGQEGYRDFVTTLGGRGELVGDILGSRITAEEAGLFAREIFNYTQTDGRYGQILKQNLLSNQFPFIVSDYPVASKTGWYHRYGGAWHDMAIIYAPSPFILVIISSDKTGTDEDHAVYQAISQAFQEFNRINFPVH